MRLAGGIAAVLLVGGCRLGFDEAVQLQPDAGDTTPPVARITVQRGGTAPGTVVGPNGFTCSAESCVLEVEPGTPINLRGLAASGSWFAGWTAVCGGNFDCSFVATADMTVIADFLPEPNRAFVTSTTVLGDFGGIGAADAICAARATAGGLEGTFIAFVSDSTTNAVARLGASRGWIRTDGAPYIDAPTAFANHEIMFPPRLDEYGNDLGSVLIYTGTDDGATTANHCLNWTTNVGSESGGMTESQLASASAWASDRACSNDGHLLCLETGRNVTVRAREGDGKRVFATSTNWVPGGGRASADALCAAEATQAGLNGTFLAAIATTTESIASRFPPGQHYDRVDGLRLLHAGSIFTTDWLDVPPELDASGQPVYADFWSGANRFDAVPDAGDNCNDWTNSTGTVNGIMHLTLFTDVRTPVKADPCDSAVPLVCIEL